MIKNPCDLACGKISIRHQACPLLQHRSISFFFQFINLFCRAPTLPDDRIVYGFPGLFIPDDCGFALVRDANGTDIFE